MSFDPKALKQIVESGGVQFRQNAISYIFECPRCLKANKLYIRKGDGRYVCWVCKETENYQGAGEWALKDIFGIQISELRKLLYGDAFDATPAGMLVVDLDFGLEDEDEIAVEPPPKPLAYPFEFVGPEHRSFLEGARYLHKRGLTIEHVRAYDIRYAPDEKRVIFPIKVNGHLIGWQARYIGRTEEFDPETGTTRRIPKILTSDSMRSQAGRFVMFQDRLQGARHCVLTEGPVSAIKAHRCGGNVATMGKAVSERQLETVLSYGVRRLYLGLDRDAANDISRIVKELDSRVECYLLMPPEGREDLGDATEAEVLSAFEAAPRVGPGTLMLSLGDEFIY
jgi:hypothetical protein